MRLRRLPETREGYCSEVVDGGDLAFDREDIPLQPAGWQPEEEDARLDELRLNVVEVK